MALLMRWLIVSVALAWLAFAVPFVIAGPDDLEEFFTGVASTKIAVDALASGAAPFWTSTMALGVPQPLRFHFISHPLAPACAGFDCQRVLRLITALHVLAGALVTGLLARQLTGNAAIGAVAGLTLLGSSSTIQPTFVDDWPLTAINEASLPLLVYAGLALLTATRRSALVWSVALGGLAGLLLSMSFPVVVLLLTGIVVLAEPARLRQQLGWYALAGVIALLIGAAQIYHLAEQIQATPPGIGRDDHPDPALALTLWSTFVRPFAPQQESSWRTVFFGPLFALSACVVAVAGRDRRLRPFRVAFLASAAGLVIPERVLFDLITSKWAYRTGINVFGIVLGAWGFDRLWRAGRTWRVAVAIAITLHVLVIASVAGAAWVPVAKAAIARVPSGERRLAAGPIGTVIQDLNLRAPGRWIFGERAYARLRELRLARHGLAPNQLPMLGVPTLNVVAYGLTLDALYPVDSMLISNTPPSAAAVASAHWLNVLGVRYVVAADRDRVSPHLVQIATMPGDLRIYRNDAAWPEAFFVSRLRDDPIPRLADCAHDRFLCADFSRYDLQRLEAEPLVIERNPDGVTLGFPPQNRVRQILLTYWWQPGWQVASGRARVLRAAEQLTALIIEPNERTVRLRYFPRVRGSLFFAGLVVEVVVLCLLACHLRAMWTS